MPKRVKAAINPPVLEWARSSAAYSRQAAAEKMGIEEEVLSSWEKGDDQPSVSQLRRLADIYKRPLAVLYLPEPPKSFRPMHDFRRLPDVGMRSYSPELAYEIRVAQQRRQLALELAEEEPEDRLPKFMLETTMGTSAEKVGQAIRDALGVTFDIQHKWRGTRTAFLAWRSRIEDLGVLVFQATRIESSEASGFAYWAEELPFIVVNQKDATGRRLFSLLHELAHLMLHQSGVSDLDEGRRPNADEKVEIFCNKVAASALMPKLQFLSQPEIGGAPEGRRDWSDEDIVALANTFSVSREAVVRRLLTLERTTEAFYRRKRAQYLREYNATRQREREKRGNKGIPRNMPSETVANVGRPLVRMLLSRYHSDRLSLAELSGFLGVKVRHVPGIEQRLGLN